MTDEEYTALLDQAAAAYRERNKWVRPEDLVRWYGAAASTDDEGIVTGRGILIQNQPPEDFGSFMSAWMKARTAPPPRWRATRFGNEPPVDPERDGCLIDEGFAVGRVRHDPLAFNSKVPEWMWMMQARGREVPTFETSGRAANKEDAKAAVERAYARLCEEPERREFFLKCARASKAASDAWEAKHRRSAGRSPTQ